MNTASLLISLVALLVAAATLMVASRQVRLAREAVSGSGLNISVSPDPTVSVVNGVEQPRAFDCQIGAAGPGTFADVKGHIVDASGNVQARLFGPIDRFDNTSRPEKGTFMSTSDDARELFFLVTWVAPAGHAVRSTAFRLTLLPTLSKYGRENFDNIDNLARAFDHSPEEFRWRWTAVVRDHTYRWWRQRRPDAEPGRMLRWWFSQGRWKRVHPQSGDRVTMPGFPFS